MALAVGRFFLELSLQEYELCQCRPSVLALCMWQVSVDYLRTYIDHDCIHYGIYVDKDVFDNCLEKVQSFFEATQLSYPQISMLHDKYVLGVE